MAFKGSCCKSGHTLPEAAHKLAAEQAKCKPDPASGRLEAKYFDLSLHLDFGLAS